MRKCGKIL